MCINAYGMMRMQMQMKIQIEMEMEIQMIRERQWEWEWEMEMHDTSRLGVVQRESARARSTFDSLRIASHRIESDWIVSNGLALSE